MDKEYLSMDSALLTDKCQKPLFPVMWVVLILGQLILSTIATANSSYVSLPGIQGGDDRYITNTGGYPWQSIGRLNSTLGGFCTAVVIAPRKILTAAHCVWNKRTAKWLPPCALHFLSAYQRGKYGLHALISKIDVAPGYRQKGKTNISHDWAVLTLDRVVAKPEQVINIYQGKMSHFNNVLQAGYSRDRPYVLTVDRGCTVVNLQAKRRLMMHSCDATYGDSGSPILLRRGERFELLGIHVAVYRKATKAAGIAVTKEAFSSWIDKQQSEGPLGGVKAC